MPNPFMFHPIIGPLIGSAVSTLSFLAGIKLDVLAIQASQWEIPAWLMQGFQIGAFSTTMLAGLATAYGVYRTHHGKKKGGRNKG